MWVDPYAVNRHPSRFGEHHDKQLGVDIQVDPMEEVMRRVEHKFQYRPEEQGIFHPLLHHGMKLRNNGAVEIFTNDDTGIRIDRNSQSINNFANHYKNHVHNMTSWLTGSEASYIEGERKIKTGGKHIIISGDTIEVTGAKDMNLKISGDVNANISGHATIEVEKDLTLHSKHLEVKADTYQTPWGKK